MSDSLIIPFFDQVLRVLMTDSGVVPIAFAISLRVTEDKNVSFETGFEDSNYFIRLFKHYEGITPKQYQQLLHKK